MGNATLLPGGDYVPELSAANFSSSPAHLILQYFPAMGGTPEVKTITTLIVPAGGTANAELKGLHGDPDLQNTFEVVSDLPPGEVVDNIYSRSETGIRWVELPGKDKDNAHNAGNHPWTVADGTDSTLLLFNETTTAEIFPVLVSSGKSVWSRKYSLAPLETKAVNINELIENRVKDDNGNVLPKSVQRGEANWYVARQFGGTGRLLQSNPAQYAARSFSCGEHGVISGADWYPNIVSEAPGQTNAFGELDAQVSLTEDSNCNGDYVGDSNDYEYGWTSSNTSVAAFSGASSGPDVDDVNVEGMSFGNATISGEVWDEYGCESGIDQDEDVQPQITGISPAQGLVGTGISVTISGAGFASGATVNAGSNISVSNVSVVSSTEITATFTPSNSTSAGGNQGVIVTVSGHASNSQNFFVQYPKHLVYTNEAGKTTNNGHSTTVSGTDINIVAISGDTVATGVCGAYQWLTYTPTDQNGNSIDNGTLIFTESFSNFSPSPDPFQEPTGNSTSTSLPGGYLGDTQALWWPTPPTCLPANDSDSFNQQFTANVGGTLSGGIISGGVNYSLTTVVTIARSTNSSGVPSFTVSITTP